MQRTEKLTVLGLGNPILDLVVDADDAYLEKYDLKGVSSTLANVNQQNIYDDILNKGVFSSPVFLAGGSCQNSIRICQSLINLYNSQCKENPEINPIDRCGFFGTIGSDIPGAYMTDMLTDNGIEQYYSISETAPTGVCAVLVRAKDRVLCTNLGAASTHAEKTIKDIPISLEEVRIVYVEGYFINVNFPLILDAARFCLNRGRIFSMNLSAEFIIHDHIKELTELLQYTRILFGNQAEIRCLSKLLYGKEMVGATLADHLWRDYPLMPSDIKSIPDMLSSERMIIITNGTEPVQFYFTSILESEKNNCFIEFNVESIPNENIIDTNGAGDAFVGGFLFGLILCSRLNIQQPWKHLVHMGNKCAANVITRSGCDFDFREFENLYDQSLKWSH